MENLRRLHSDIEDIKRNLVIIKNILKEDYELSGYAKDELKKARKTPISKYINHEDLKKNLLK
ncbi:MAG: hypothetical protein AABW45_02540 [Nanoarchaeota archaeon]